MSAASELVPVHVITGFLGSGKTTLLGHLLRDPALADCAVLINEFGEIGLDHHLVERVEGDIVLMQSGCICCTIRGDLGRTIRDLWSRRERGEVAPFRRLAIETTGLADPVPVLATIMSEPVIRHHFRLGRVLTTVDAVNGGGQAAREPEWVKQAAVADRLVVTKADLAAPAALDALEATLRAINPAATLFRSANALPAADALLGEDALPPPPPAGEGRGGGTRELDASNRGGDAASDAHHHDPVRHDGIVSFALVFDEPIEWAAFGIWLGMLIASHGENVLRVKGILRVEGAETPVAVHAVQHLVHAPVHLARWPDEERRSRLVFIVRDLDPAALRRSLAAFRRLGRSR